MNTTCENDVYLSRYAVDCPTELPPPASDIALIVVIPSYKEPDIKSALLSLVNCDPPPCPMEIIVVINAPEYCTSEDLATNAITRTHINEVRSYTDIPILIINAENLPKKHAGVGLARKIGMDEAYRRFASTGNQNKGVIACFDADATCTQNYLTEIYAHFHHHKTSACSIYFEHQLDNISDVQTKQAIVNYELHLRYYVDGLRYTGHPHAYQTIGSSMAIRASNYAGEGGMNKKKAGEDFYFLMKFIQRGDYSELNSVTVFPSSRTSDRVPFGTGRAMLETQSGSNRYELTYDFEIFRLIKSFFDLIPQFYESIQTKELYQALDERISSGINRQELETMVQNCRDHSSSLETFTDRFYRTFNIFRTMKLIHHMRDSFMPNSSLLYNAQELLKVIAQSNEHTTEEQCLMAIRALDKSTINGCT